MTCDNVAEDDLIEYCPESPSDSFANAHESAQLPPLTVYVCSLCLRQYDLIDDLRGHMMLFHGCQPIERQSSTRPNNRLAASAEKASRCVATKLVAKVPLPEEKTEVVKTLPRSKKNELKPMAFKDFRIVLRAHMQLRCTVQSNCAYKFENQDKLELHSKCHKQTTNGFTCYECALELPNWRRCSMHLWQTHQVNVDLLQCPICEYKSPVSVHIWRHMRVHKRWRPRVLRSLRAVFRKRQEFKQSKAAEATPATARTTLTVPAAAAVVRPNKNKYYSEKTCEICSRTFVNGKTLSKHVKTVHNKIKPFICSVCGKKTARKASLIIHMRQHTGEKPLQCKTCKFSTRDPSVLHKHKMRHEKQDKLACAHCTYTCIQANAYKRHLRLNHPEEYRKLACDLCSYSTINTAKLHAHKEDHRKGLIVNCEDSMDASRAAGFKYPRKLSDKNNEISADCFMPLESIDSMPHEPAVDTGGVTIPAPSEDTQFPTYLNN